MTRYILLIATSVLFAGCASDLSLGPTPYSQKLECDIVERLRFEVGCRSGYSSSIIGQNRHLVSFEGRSRTSLERATDFAILRCSELALEREVTAITFAIVERQLVSSISTNSDGNVSSSDYPLVSIECDFSGSGTSDALSAIQTNSEIRTKYGI